MKAKIKQMAIAIVAVVMLVTVFQLKTTKAMEEGFPQRAVGCKYTGYFLDSCSAVEGATIYRCTNMILAINCYYDPSNPIED